MTGSNLLDTNIGPHGTGSYDYWGPAANRTVRDALEPVQIGSDTKHIRGISGLKTKTP